jgi:glycosyltransferase involved in cell wall biosynthesis
MLLLEALIAAGDNGRIESVNLAALENVKPHFPKLPSSPFPIRVHRMQSRRASALQRLIDRIRPDILHSPFELPGRIHGCPIVYTLYDAGRYLYPHLMVKRVREVESPKLIKALRECEIDALVTVSEASRVDIEKLLPLGELKCSVIPNFIAQSFWRALASPTNGPTLETRYGIQGDYLLSVGIFSPTKNIPTLCEAFCSASQRHPDRIPRTLVLVGRKGWERNIRASGRAKIVVTVMSRSET